MNGPGVGSLVMLVKSVARLALPPEVQLAYLEPRRLLPSIDERALELDDFVGLTPRFVENGWLGAEEASAIAALADVLRQMSGPDHADLWTADALGSTPEWAEVRRMAQEIVVSDLRDQGSSVMRPYCEGSRWRARSKTVDL